MRERYAIHLWGMHICAFVGMKSLKCQLQPHRLNTSHIYNIYLRTVHRGLAPLGQVKDCSLEFLCSLDRLGPKDCPSVCYLGQVSSGIGHPWQGSITEHFQFRISRDEATHYTIGVFLPQNPFSHINFAFSSVTFFSTAWVINILVIS